MAGSYNLSNPIPLPVSQGGTGDTTLTANSVLLGNGTSAINPLANGSVGQVLTATSGTPAWATPSGGGGVGAWNLIQSQTASTSATLDFTTGLSGYQVYAFVVDRMQPDTNDDDLNLLVSTDGGSTWINSGYTTGTSYWLPGTTPIVWYPGGDSTTSLAYIAGITGTQGLSLITYISTSAGVNPYLWGDGFFDGVPILLQGQNTTTSVVNGYRWICTSGNILSGTFSLYGLNTTTPSPATKPCFSAYLSSEQTNVTGDSTPYNIPYDSVNFDNGSNFDTGTGAFTAPTTGQYEFFVNTFLISVVPGTVGTVSLSVNGGSVVWQLNQFNPTAIDDINGNTIINGSIIISLNANDTVAVQLVVYHSTLTTSVYGTATPSPTLFMGYLLT